MHNGCRCTKDVEYDYTRTVQGFCIHGLWQQMHLNRLDRHIISSHYRHDLFSAKGGEEMIRKIKIDKLPDITNAAPDKYQ